MMHPTINEESDCLRKKNNYAINYVAHYVSDYCLLAALYNIIMAIYGRNITVVLVFPTGQVINICPTREITASSGQIRSPNYPSNYSSNTSCTLTIKQPLDTNFTFTFTNLDIEIDEDGG